MFREHDFIIWGTHCKCGHECSILQNEHHPWDESSFTINLTCPHCGKEIAVNNLNASLFYDKKIYSYFNGVHGNIIDLGCGDGFLSKYILNQNNIEKVYGLDIDNDCENQISDLIQTHSNFQFINSDINALSDIFKSNSIDFLVSRDVFMFIEDTNAYFDNVSIIITNNIKQMGWYVKGNKRMKNNLTPDEIAEEYEKHGWIVKLEYLNWYKSGYFIDAYRPAYKK